jgi:hypothetical protein
VHASKVSQLLPALHFPLVTGQLGLKRTRRARAGSWRYQILADVALAVLQSRTLEVVLCPAIFCYESNDSAQCLLMKPERQGYKYSPVPNFRNDLYRITRD